MSHQNTILDNNPEILHVGQALIKFNPGWCSGFFIRPDLIVTAGHCLRDRYSKLVEIYLRNGQTIGGIIHKSHFGWDVGLIKTTAIHHQKPLVLSDGHVPLDEEMYSATLREERTEKGRPFDVEFGRYNGMTAIRNEDHLDQWTAPMLHCYIPSKKGKSGSPVVRNGKVYGVLVAGSPTETFAVPSKYITQLIRE